MDTRKTSIANDNDDAIEHGGAHPYTRRVSIGPHPKRKNSRQYNKSKKKLKELDSQCGPLLYGKPPYEDHHGGGLWLKDEDGWFMVKNQVGMEWSSQFCADPAKVDQMRRNARRLYAAFPAAVEELGIRELLDTEIVDAAGVAHWVDSICNASVPLPSEAHRGTLPGTAGAHHYPEPIVDIQYFKRDDFPLWVEDDEGGKAAVVPVGERGSGDGRVLVLAQESEPDAGGQIPRQRAVPPLDLVGRVLDGSHPLARRAFSQQNRALTDRQIPETDPMRRLLP